MGWESQQSLRYPMGSHIPNNLSNLNLVSFSHKPADIFNLMKPRFTLKILFAKHGIRIICNCTGRKFQCSRQNVRLFVLPTCVSLYPLPLSTTEETSYVLTSSYTIQRGKKIKKCISSTFELHNRPYQSLTNISAWGESCLANP